MWTNRLYQLQTWYWSDWYIHIPLDMIDCFSQETIAYTQEANAAIEK